VEFRPGYRGFLDFCRILGVPLEDFQKRIARAHFGPEREVVAILPRGSIKSTTASLIAVHHVLTVDDPTVYVGAASQPQARVVGGMIRDLVRHPELRRWFVWRTDAVRWAKDPKGPAIIQVVPSDGSRAHGWPRPTLILADEVWAWSDREPSLLGAMLTSMLKVPTCRFLGISTSAARLDAPLGRLRSRAMAAPRVERKGVVTEAGGDGLRWLEWSLADDEDPDDLRLVAKVNPLRSVDELREQRKRVTDIEWQQFHCCRWGVGEGAWLPPGAWAACRGEVGDGTAPVWLGVDVGGSRASTALIGVDAELRVCEVHVLTGTDAVLRVAELVVEIAERRSVVEVAFDPWRFQSEALRLERDHGLRVVEFPQSHSRMVPASEGLHRVITQRVLTHPGHPELDRQVAAAVAKQTGRGWRLDKLTKETQIDAAVALAMAVERAEAKVPEFRVLAVL